MRANRNVSPYSEQQHKNRQYGSSPNLLKHTLTFSNPNNRFRPPGTQSHLEQSESNFSSFHGGSIQAGKINQRPISPFDFKNSRFSKHEKPIESTSEDRRQEVRQNLTSALESLRSSINKKAKGKNRSKRAIKAEAKVELAKYAQSRKNLVYKQDKKKNYLFFLWDKERHCFDFDFALRKLKRQHEERKALVNSTLQKTQNLNVTDY